MAKQEAQNSIDLVTKLFKMAMRGDWHTVVGAYAHSSGEIIKKYEDALVKRETALHVAVAAANEETEHVSEIIGGIPKGDLSKILRMGNRRGNTPLHLAAAMGKKDICWLIASEDKSLIAERNEQDETPLFLAAHRGHEDAFFYLEFEFGRKDVARDMLKNKSDNTVLHSAIYGQHYGLAIRILQSYPDLINEVNEKRLTPLHVLALQHRSFKSSTVHLGLFDLIFYQCIIIRKETWEDRENSNDIKEIDRNRKSPKYPKNYKTCFDIYGMLKGIFVKTSALLASGRGCGASRERTDNTPSLEGGNRKYIRKGYIEENGPSTTICDMVFQILKYVSFVPLHFLVSGRLLSIAKRKKKHKLAEQLLNDLLDKACSYKLPELEAPSTSKSSKTTSDALPQVALQGNGSSVATTSASPGKKEEEQQQQQSSEPCDRLETPFLTAARLGIKEMVEAILNKFPEAIEDEDFQSKNAVLLAAEHRRSRVYRLLEKKTMVKESIFCQVDADGNSALHLASRYNPDRPWFIPGPALQMKWEIIWHQYVKSSMPSNSFALRNKEGKTAQEIFKESHKGLKDEGKEWLSTTSTAYSVISTLIATVAFATSSSIPGDYDDGKPALEREFAFSVFSISSLIALCTSMSATVFFIAILTTRYEQEDFATKLPGRLQFGLTFLFASIASILVSFSSGFYFSVRNKLENAAYPIFAVMCLPVTLFAAAQLPLYVGLNRDIFFNPKDKIQHYDHDIDTH